MVRSALAQLRLSPRAAVMLVTVSCGGAVSTASPGEPSGAQAAAQPAVSGSADRVVAELRSGNVAAVARATASIEEATSRTEQRQLLEALDRFYFQHVTLLSETQQEEALRTLIEHGDVHAAEAPAFCLRSLLGASAQVRAADVVLLAYQEGQLDALAPVMIEVFAQFRAHSPAGRLSYRRLLEAIVARPRQEWVPELLQKLEAPMKHPRFGVGRQEQRALIDPYRDQAFWQISAAQALGVLRSVAAVDPLFRVLFDPMRKDVHTTALLALVRIGAPAQRVAAEVLSGSRKFPEPPASPPGVDAPSDAVTVAGAVLGLGSLKSSEPILVDAIAREHSGSHRALLAAELVKVSRSALAIATFEKVYEGLSSLEKMQDGRSWKGSLAESAADFFDERMTPWLLRQAGKATNADLRRALLMSAARVASEAQLPSVKAAAGREHANLMFLIEGLLSRCKQNATCFLQAASEPQNQEFDRQFIGIKAASMVVPYGSPADAPLIIEELPQVKNTAVHFALLKALDALLPDGDLRISRQLLASESVSSSPALRQVAYRLEARALEE